MKIAFTCFHLNVRGTTVALYDYALNNEKILGNESVILTSAFCEFDAISKFNEKFRVFVYGDINDLEVILQREKIDALYILKEGKNDGWISKKVPTFIHCIFMNYEPHGFVYAYVSKWLSQKMGNGNNPYVPHIVSLPDVKENLRAELNIPESAIVFGRYGGQTEFCIRYVRKIVIALAKKRKDMYFLFMNTNRFNKRWPNKNIKNIIYLPKSTDMVYKTRFINTCDAMLHAREEGETFGLAICEFLHQDKPVFAWNGGRDRHHIDVLSQAGTLYNSKEDLLEKLNNFKRQDSNGKYKKLVAQFAPEVVMRKFKEVFLDALTDKMSKK